MKITISILLALFSIQSFGQCSPTLKEIYDFEVGDKFVYRNTSVEPGNGWPVYTYTYDSLVVLKNLSNGDSIKYQTIIFKYGYSYIDTILFIDSTNHSLNKCEGTFVNIWESPFFNEKNDKKWDTADLFVKIKTPSEDSTIKLIEGNQYSNKHFYIDSSGFMIIFPYDTRNEFGTILKKYQRGFGLQLDQFQFFEESTIRELMQVYRNGDTLLYSKLGSIYPKTLLSQISAYPNPTQSRINIFSPHQIQSIRLYNSAGNLVLTELLNKQIDLSPFTSGMYFIKVKTSKGIIRKKVYKK